MTRGWCLQIVVFIIIYGFVMSCKNKIMYVLSGRTVSALTRGVLFWCLLNNTLVRAEAVRHSSTYVILYLLSSLYDAEQFLCVVTYPDQCGTSFCINRSQTGWAATIGNYPLPYHFINPLAPGGFDYGLKFQTHFKDKYLKYFLWNCYQVNATTLHWSSVKIGSLLPDGTKPLPEPMLTQIYVTIWRHSAPMCQLWYKTK